MDTIPELVKEKALLGINQKLIEILGKEKGYFGYVPTYGQRPTEYEYIGYELSEDFSPILENMTEDQQKNFVDIMNYFEIHLRPLKKLLDTNEKDLFEKFYNNLAWSHFATVVMFGMLELAIKGRREDKLNDKGKKIKEFLINNLPENIQKSITERFKVEEVFNHKKIISNFSDVVDHMWEEIRCGFIHKASIESKGFDWFSFQGMGTKENPISVKSDVPMQEWLQLTWQSILNYYGYKGVLRLPKLV